MTFKKVSKRRYLKVFFFLVLIVFIQIITIDSLWVEKYYSNGFFPIFSAILRIMAGWLPFSIGDVLYLFAGIWLIYKLIRFIIKLTRRQVNGKYFRNASIKVLLIATLVYIIFNIFWGLNYNRKGVGYQLKLELSKYDSGDLKNIQQLLLDKVNKSKQVLINKHESYPKVKKLFSRAYMCYNQSEQAYPFLHLNYPSLKPSAFGWLGNYLGFTGYYNPFSGEAQINTTVPRFILPYIACHEIAHQLGYAKEDEASLAGYIAATVSNDTLFHYSAYLDLFLYANRDLFFIDSVAAKQVLKQLIPEVRADIKEYREFLLRYKSAVEPFIHWAYGRYLIANQQPKGMRTYNEVIAGLIAFYKKNGKI